MSKAKKTTKFHLEIGLQEGQNWSTQHLDKVKSFAKKVDSRRTLEQRRKNEMEAIRFRMEEYANTEESNIREKLTIEDCVKLYLSTLDINFKTFATSIDTSDANLKKYLKGERKFNEDLACRFGKFFHVSPLTWMRVQHKNDLVSLSRIQLNRQYKKYDFEKVIN